MQNRPIPTTPTAWFLRGLLAGILVCGGLNAVSYFFRSDGWGDLLGRAPEHAEALGFPMQSWEEGSAYGGYFVDLQALSVNAVCAVAVGIVGGALAVRQRHRFNRIVDQFEHVVASEQRNLHFSLRGLLGATALVALLAAGARHILAGRPEVLGAIHLLGPWLLVSIALLPYKIPWQQRVLILAPAALLLIVVAIVAGASLHKPVDLDKVLLGIFVCWTPQSALAAVACTAWLILSYGRAPRGSNPK